MDNKSDEIKLLKLLKAGDFNAFTTLYEKYYRQVYHFALYLSKNTHESEEIVQVVFVSVWEKREMVDPEKSFGNYLFRIAQNRFYDMVRKRVSESCYADYIRLQDEMMVEDIVSTIENEETKEIIQLLLSKVPERRREIFMLSRIENLSYKQIAEQLHISENTVDTQIRNVLNYLRKELPKYLTVLFF